MWVSEREQSIILPRAEGVDDGLADEEPSRDADSDCNHGTADVDAAALCGDASDGRETRLSEDG